jgi:hypothetical protein
MTKRTQPVLISLKQINPINYIKLAGVLAAQGFAADMVRGYGRFWRIYGSYRSTYRSNAENFRELAE